MGKKKRRKRGKGKGAPKPKFSKLKKQKHKQHPKACAKHAIIWLVRHAQAEGNQEHILNGTRIDAPLTELGRAQAGYLAANFPFKPDAILSSPLARAMQTATALAKRFGMQIIILPLCVEQDYGKLSGKSMDELRKSPAYRKYFHISESEKAYALNPPGGESWEDLKKRAAKCLRWLDRHYAGKKVVVVSHSDFINCIYGVKNGLEDSKIWLRGDLQNCQIIRI